jgi:heme/copper-type cytochrome/quinol oxidase subunit 3
MVEAALSKPENLPVGPIGRHGVGWWGIGTLVVSEAALFGYLLFAYFYTGATAPPGWLLEPAPRLTLALPNTILLILSSAVAWWAEQGIVKQRPPQALIGFGVAFLMGAGFVAVQWLEWRSKTFSLGTSSYASLYFVTGGVHVAHLLVGLVILLFIFGWTALDFFSPRRRLVVSAAVLYWYFVTIASVLVFSTYYLTPYLGFGQ